MIVSSAVKSSKTDVVSVEDSGDSCYTGITKVVEGTKLSDKRCVVKQLHCPKVKFAPRYYDNNASMHNECTSGVDRRTVRAIVENVGRKFT